jgi:predicted transcriptional regulator of viral defense system
MAEPEKTVLDCLDRPVYAGGIPEVAGMLWQGQGRLDWPKLAGYALRYKSQALVQRLGCLIDLLGLSAPAQARDALLTHVGRARPTWDNPSSEAGGTYHAAWHLMANIPREALLADIEVR